MSASKFRTLNWTSILGGLAQLHQDNPDILKQNVLVGGAACMFYRDQLEQISDPDFRVRTYEIEEEKSWLSHDADFATTDPSSIPNTAGDIPLGRLQMGFVLGADEFKENARTIELAWDQTSFSMLIADPLDLWREKEAAIYRRRSAQDPLHLEILSLTLEWETIYFAELVAEYKFSPQQWIERATEVKRRYTKIFESEPVKRRIISTDFSEFIKFAYPSETTTL